MKMVKVYVRCDRDDGTEIHSPIFEIPKKEYDHYWSDNGGDDAQYWPEEWYEFEDEIDSTCLELVEEAV